MTETFDIEALVDEIRRYLAAVDAFRAAGYAPQWMSASAAGPRTAAARSDSVG